MSRRKVECEQGIIIHLYVSNNGSFLVTLKSKYNLVFSCWYWNALIILYFADYKNHSVCFFSDENIEKFPIAILTPPRNEESESIEQATYALANKIG